MSFFVFGGVSTVAVHADTTSGNLTAATVNSTSDTKSAVSSAATVASSSSATKADSANATSTNKYSASASNLSKTGAVSTSNSTEAKANAKYANSVETAVTSPELKGYTADKAQIDKQTVNGDSKDLAFTVTYTKNAPTMMTEKKTVNETVRYVAQNRQVLTKPHTASIDFTRQVSTDAVTGEKTYGAWSADQSFAAVTSPELKGYTADKAQIDKQTVNGDSKDLAFTVTYTKNAPTMTTEKKTVNETVSYVDQNGNVLTKPHTASVDFTRQVSTDAVTGEKTYGAWSADQSFAAVTSPELKGYTADKAQIDKQTVNGDSKDLAFTVTYTKNAPTMTTEKKTVNETVRYVDQNGQVLTKPHTASVDFTRSVSTDAVTGEKTYGAWSADQSFAAVTSPELKGYTADKAQIDKQTVNGDSKDLAFTVTYTKNAPTMTTEKKTVNETVRYVDQNGQVLTKPHTASVDFTRSVSTDAVTGEKTYGAWSADQSFAAVTSPELKGYTADKAQIDKQTVNGDSKDLAFTVTYTKNAPTMTTEKKTVNETVRYVDQNGQVLTKPHTASVDFTRSVSTDAVTGEKTYGAWSADQSFAAVTSPELKGYTADKAQIDKQTVNGDSKDLAFTVTYTKNAPTMTTEKKTVNETVRYVDQNGQVLTKPHTASVDFTRSVSTDAVTGEKTYGAWSADQSFAAVTSPELKGYTADKAQIDKQTVNGDSKDLAFTVTYTKNAPTMTTEKKTVNETVRYVDQNGQVLTKPHTASVDFTRSVSTDAVTGEKTYGAWSADQSFAAVTSPELKGYTADKAQIDKQTVNGDSKDLAFTVTYTKNAPTMTTEKKTVNETVRYVDQNGQVLTKPHTASVDFTRSVSTDAVTGEKTYGAWSADQSFAAVTSPELKGYTADKAQIDKQTVNGDSKDLAFTVTYTKNAPTMTTEKKTVNETVRYVDQNGQVLTKPHTASVDFTRSVSTDAVTGEKTYGAWSADQSFAAVTSPELKGYTADKAQIDKQTVNGDSKDLAFTVTYTKNAPTMTTEKKTVNETVRYVDQNGQVLTKPHTASVDFTRSVSTDAVTGEKTYGAWSADQSFAAVTSPELKGYTADKAQIDKQTVNGDSEDLAFTVTYTKNAPTMTTEKKTVNETVRYVDQNGQVLDTPHTASVDFTRSVSIDAVTGEKTYGAWSADQSFAAVTSPELKGYTADKAQIDKQTVNGDSEDLAFTVTYTKNAPTMTTEKKTVNETVHYVDQNGQVLDTPHTASVDFTRSVSIDAVTGEKTYGAWSADQSFAAVTSPELKGYTADKAQIDKQTVNGDSEDLAFTVTYTKNAPTMTTEKKTVNETVRYVDQNGQVLDTPHTASVDFTRSVSIDAVTGEKTYGAWSADQSFAAVTSPELKGYTADKAQIDKQTVNGDSEDLAFTVTYTKNAPTMTTEKKTVNETVRYVDQNGQVLDTPHTASVDFTRSVSIDAVTGEKTYGAWSADQSFAAVTSPELKGYTADKAQIDKQTVNGDSEDLAFTVTYTKNAPTMTTEKKTVNETVRYVDQNGQVLDTPHTASVDFTRSVSIDAVTGEKTYGAWSADQSFAAVTSPELKGYTADKAQIDKQTVNGDSEDLAFTVTYTKNAPTMTTEKKTVNETVHYVDQNGQVLDTPHTASVDFTRSVSIDAVTGEKTYGAWSADQSFAAVTSPELKGYTADKAQIDKQTVNGDSEDLAFTVTYTKNAPTMTTEKKTVNETVHYVDQNGQVLTKPHTASVDFTRSVSTDAVTGEKTYGAWSADQSFAAVTSPELKGYTADKAQIDKQTVNGDSEDLAFTVTYTKNAPTMTTEKKTVNETVHYVDQNGQVLDTPHTASVDFTRSVSIDAVTGEKTYGAWSADQSFAAVTSPELKGYTADKAQIDKQTVNGDSEDLAFTVTYTKNAPTMTTEKKTVNETVRYVDQNGQVLDTPHTASVDFTRSVSIDAVTGEKTYGAWSADQSFAAVTSPELKGYTADKAQIDKQTVNGDSEDLAFTVTYTKNAPTMTTEKKTVNETVRYVDQNGQVLDTPHTASVDFTRSVSIDAVTGEKTYGAWSADQSFAAVTSPELKGYTADKAQIDKQTVNGDSEDLAFTVTYTKNAPTMTTEKKTVNETVRYVDQNGQVLDTPHTASVDFTRSVSTDAVTGEKTYGAWSADQSFAAVTSPELKGYTADKAQIDKQTVNGDSEDLAFTVTYTKNAPTMTTEKKTVNETVHYVDQNGQVLDTPHTASVDFTRSVSIDAVTGEKTYGAWSADQSFAAVTSPELKGYTADKAQIDKQTVNGDSEDLAFTVTYTKNAPTMTTEKKTVNETVHYVDQNGQVLDTPHTASVDFTRSVSIDAVTGEKTYGAWSADQSFAAVTSPELKGYTADKAQIDKQTVNGDSEDLAFTVTYTKNAPTMTTEKKTVNETVRYVDQNGQVLDTPHTASVDFTRSVSIDAVTGEKTYGAWSADQSFAAVTSPELKGYTADKAQIDKQTVNGDSEDLAFTVTYTKNAPTMTTEKKTVNETVRYVDQNGQVLDTPHTASVDFTRSVSIDAVTGEKTYGAWSADQSFAAVTSPELKGYTADKAQIDKQTVNGDSEDLAFTVTYTKNAPTMTTEKKTVNETVRYVDQNGQVLDTPHTASVDFTRSVSIDAVTGEKTYGAWSADQSFAAVTSPELKGYTADKAQIDKQTVNGDSEDLAFTVTYTKNAPTMTTEKKTVNETVHYVDQNGQVLDTPHTASVDFTRSVSIDAVTGEKTYGAWSADQSFAAVTSPELKGYTADKAQIDKQTVNGDSEDLAFTVTYTKNAPTMTTEKKTVNETVHYVDQNGQVLTKPHTASVDFTRSVSTDAVTGEKTYGAWSADQSFAAVTSPELKGYTADKAQIDKQTVNGDSEDLAFTVTYTKNAPTMTTEKKTVNETVHYVDQNGQVLDTPHTASVDFTRSVSIDAVTGEKTYGAWSADQSFAAVTSPELKGYTADKAQIDKQTVNGDSEDLAFTVTYTKNAPTMTTEKKTVNETVRYVDQNGQVLDTPHTASVDFTRSVSIDAVTGEKTYGAWSADQSFAAVTSPELKGYTADKAQIDKQTVNGDSEDLAFTVTYTKNAPTMTTEKKTVVAGGNVSNQPGNPSQPSNATNNGVINTSIGILLAMFGSLLGFLGIKKRRND
ncbi:mucin-binding protein [Limosilactobacillus fermentum]